MKRIFAVFVSAICFCICYQASAQNDVYLVPNPQTARWSYIETDSKGKHVLTVYNSIEAVEGDGVNGAIKLRVEEVPVASPKDTTRSFMFFRFKDGEFVVDLSAGFEDTMFEGRLDSSIRDMIDEKYPDLPEEAKKEVLEEARSEFIKITGETRGIPRYPEVGKLPDYESQVKVSMIGMKVTGSDRRIVGRETVQTEAGSYDCFILEETITTKSMMMKEVDKIKAWYAYGIGLVKEITYDKKGNLISTMILSEINW
jgi:hypothetical protein